MRYIQDRDRFVEQALTKGESIIYRVQVHWAIFIESIMLAVLFLVFTIAGFVSVYFFIVSVGFGFFAVSAAMHAMVTYMTTELVLTNKRVVGKTGFIRCHSIDLLLGKVESIKIEQGIMGRLFDYGTVVVSGTGTTNASFPGIMEPLKCRRAIQDVVGAG